MAVESGKVFSILAHELRSPIGVIQGYVRMLRMRRADDDQETKMLTAMLDATGRISAVARQASELAVWQEGTPGGEARAVSLDELVRHVAAAELPRPITADVTALAQVAIRTWQVEALSAAVTALVIAAQRSNPDQEIAIHSRRLGDDVALLIGSTAALASWTTDSAVAEADAGRAGERLFASGGQGLSLVLAASVLDRHGISVGLIEASGIVVLRLPKDRGRQ